jgi:hypothetical protein
MMVVPREFSSLVDHTGEKRVIYSLNLCETSEVG